MRIKRYASCIFVCAFWILAVGRSASAQLQLTMDNSTLDSEYESQPPAPRGINAEFESRVTHDSNIFNNNARPESDFIYQEGALVNFWATDPRWGVALQYRPTFLIYSQGSSLNSFDNNLRFNGNYRATQRLQLFVNESFDEFTGILQPSSNEYFSVPVSPVPTLNVLLLTPTSHEISNSAEGHLVYDLSSRATIDLMGSYGLQNFSSIRDQISSLFDTSGPTAGAQYRYRLSRHFSLGAKYLYQDYSYGLGGSDQSHSALMTANWQLGPHQALELHAGAAHSYTTGASVLNSQINASTGQLRSWSPVGGGSFTFRSDQTVLQFSGERLVTSGGGLLMTVTDSYGVAELRRQITPNWDILLTGSGSHALALEASPNKGTVDAQTVGGAVEHTLFDKWSLHFEYDYLRQRVNQFVPLGTNVNRNAFSAGVFYRLGEGGPRR